MHFQAGKYLFIDSCLYLAIVKANVNKKQTGMNFFSILVFLRLRTWFFVNERLGYKAGAVTSCMFFYCSQALFDVIIGCSEYIIVSYEPNYKWSSRKLLNKI